MIPHPLEPREQTVLAIEEEHLFVLDHGLDTYLGELAEGDDVALQAGYIIHLHQYLMLTFPALEQHISTALYLHH